MGDQGGSKDHPTAETLVPTTTSEARVGGAEESGRPTRKRGKGEDRKLDFLGRKATSSSKGGKDSARKSGKVHIKEEGNQAGKVTGIRKYFEEKAGGLSSNLGNKGNE